MIDIATVAVIALPSATIGAFLAYTFLPRKGEGSPNPCDDACTIERLNTENEFLTQERDYAMREWRDLRKSHSSLVEKYNAVEAQNHDLHIDIAEKAKRLSDAGLQSAGGCDE